MRFVLTFLLITTIALATFVERPRSRSLEAPAIPSTLPVSVPINVRPVELSTPRANWETLDEISCYRNYGLLALDTTTRNHGLATGWAVHCWLDGTCGSCGPSEPVRIDSIRVRFSRFDGSPADTLDLMIEFRCPADGLNACSRLGYLRDFRMATVVFPADSADEIEQIVVSDIVFESVLSDSIGTFVGLVSQGTRQGTWINLQGDADGTEIQPCDVLVMADSLEDWTNVWGDFSGPPVQIFYACDLGDSVIVSPCADVCEFTNFLGLQAYFDPNTNVVYQWFDPGDLQLPLQPLGIDFKLYFEALGASNDTAYLRLLFSCAGFEDVCCPPAEPMCTVFQSVRRGTPFQTVLDVHATLQDINCCLSEPFWLGLVIDSVSGGATLPSFLYSAASTDPDPPLPCEQWTGSAGTLSAERSDDIGWADIHLSGLCRNCGGQAEALCEPETHVLDCQNAADVPCSEAGALLVNQFISASEGQARRYCCSDLSFPGAELIYRMQIPNQGNLQVRATTDTLEHCALFLVETCDPRQCVAFGIDSLFASGLTNGEYFIVVESLNGTAISLDLTFICIADCNHDLCQTDLRGAGGLGNRYLDGEGDGAGEVFFQSYYSGAGTAQQILRFDAANCLQLAPVTWQSQESSPCRMLAYDPRNGGEFWCGTTIDFFAGTGRLYRLSSGGGVIQSWTALPGLSVLRWSGAAFDPTHQHMWVFIRDSSNTGISRAYELDLSNPEQPEVIQGPHLLPHQSPNQSLSCAGADYAHLSNHLLVVHQGSPDDFVQCYEDLNPGYSGPQPGPGFVPVAWCTPDSNSLQGYGVSAIEDSLGGTMAMTNFTDADWEHPVALCPPPCRLTPPRCLPPSNLSIAMVSGGSRLTWMATYPGVYDIYSAVNPENDGDPDGGLDTLFTLEASLPLPAGPADWEDLHDITDYRIYSIVLTCSTAASPAGFR